MAEKEITNITCRKCGEKLSKQLWGKNKSQHYRLTCEKCGFSILANEEFLKVLENNEEVEKNEK